MHPETDSGRPGPPDPAPHIFRQRLLVEGFYAADLDAGRVSGLLAGLAAALRLTPYGEAAVYSPAGRGKAVNQGFDAFLPLVDSGIAGYFWTAERFFSVLVYSCAPFAPQAALDYLARALEASGPLVSRAF